MGMSEVVKYFVKVLLSLSLSGAVLAAGLLALQALLGRRLSQRWRYYIWLVVVAKLLIPVTIQSSFMGHLFDQADAYLTASPQAVVEQPAAGPQQEPQQWAPAALAEAEQTESMHSARETPPQAERAETLPQPQSDAAVPTDLWRMAWRVWLGVSGLLILRTAVSYRRYRRQLLLGNLPVTDSATRLVYTQTCQEMGVRKPPRLAVNPDISSPLLAGLFRPVIVLPPLDAGQQELRYIFLHELTHYKRRDGWYKLLVHLTVSLHWFNPMAYKVRREMEKACELSCDEAVIRRLDAESRLDYGDVLLSVIQSGRQSHNIPALMLGEDAGTVKSRLAAILRFRPRTKWMLAAAGALTLVLGTAAVCLGGYTIPHGRAYDNDMVIARESDSMNGQGILRSVEEDGSIHLSLGRLDGVKTFLRMEVSEDTQVELSYDVALRRGDYKIVLIREDQVLDTIAEGTSTGSRTVELTAGAYRLKSVGRGAQAEATVKLAADGGVLVTDPDLDVFAPIGTVQTDPQPVSAAADDRPDVVEYMSSDRSATVTLRRYSTDWVQESVARGTTREEVLDEKLRYLESVARRDDGDMIFLEGISADEVTDMDGVRYMYEQSEVYRELITVTDTVMVDPGFSGGTSGEEGQEVAYIRHSFYIDRPAMLDLRANYEVSQGKTGFVVVSPQGEIVHRQEPTAYYSDQVYLPLTEGLWSIVLINELEDGLNTGRKYMMGFLSDENGTYPTGLPSKEEIIAEYAAVGFSYDDMTYQGQQVAYFDDRRTGGWIAVTRKSAAEDAAYLSIRRDNSVPGPLGFGQITAIDVYTKEEWDAVQAALLKEWEDNQQ